MFLESFKGSRYSPAYKLLYRVREVRFLLGGGGGGSEYFRNFLRKKLWPSHFPEWINA